MTNFIRRNGQIHNVFRRYWHNFLGNQQIKKVLKISKNIRDLNNTIELNQKSFKQKKSIGVFIFVLLHNLA